MSTVDLCPICHQPVMAGGVYIPELKKIFCINCSSQWSLCAICKNCAYCDGQCTTHPSCNCKHNGSCFREAYKTECDNFKPVEE